MDSTTDKHHEVHHVHFPPEDISRKEGKGHNKALDALNIHKPEHVSLSSHVFIAEEDIARKEGKEHNKALDVLNVHKPENVSLSTHVKFTDDDLKRKEGKEHNKELDALNVHKPKNVSLSTHVHFTDEDLKRKEGKEHDKSLDKYNVHATGNPLKVKVSKEDFFLHLKIGLILTIIFFGGTYYSSTLPPREKTTSIFESMDELVENLEEVLYALKPPTIPNPVIRNEHKLHSDCNVVLAQSSIPNSIFGVFTRKDLKAGDEIFGPSDLITLQDDVHVHPSLPLIKHHPVFANVEVNPLNAIVATIDVPAGSELFINLAEDSFSVGYRDFYQMGLYPNDPTKEDYMEADLIIKELFDIIPLIPEKEDRKTGRRTGKRQPAMKRKMIPTVDAGSMLKIYRDHIGKYNSRLKSLIPVETNEARSVLDNGSTLTFISNVRDLEWLEKHSLCLDELRIEKISSDDDSVGVFTTHSVSAGSIISSAPLFVALDHKPIVNCFKFGEKYVCPLAATSFVRTSDQTCSERDSCSKNIANSFFRFSSSNALNMYLFKDSDEGELMKNQMTGLTIDVVAMRDMKEGEEIIIQNDIVIN